MAVLFATLSALLYGGADFAGGYAARKSPVLSVVVLSQLAGVAIAAAAAPLLGAHNPTAIDLGWGGAAGLSGALGLIALYRGIARTIVAVVSPVSALIGALVPLLFGLAAGESPSPLAWGGTALCLPAAVLLSYEKTGAAGHRVVRSALFYGLLAGLGFGGFFIAISRPAAEAGLWPLVMARTTSILAVLLGALSLRRPLTLARGALGLVLITGVCDMGANIAFVLANRHGLLILVTVITSLFPAPTVVLARVFMDQRLGPLRAAGLTAAVAGVALIGLG